MPRSFSKKAKRKIIAKKVGSLSIYSIFFGISMLLTFMFSNFEGIYTNAALLSNTNTIITTIENVRETGTVIMEEYVMQYDFQIALPGLGQFPGSSFSRGLHYEIGDTVSVEYSVSNPYVNNIQGMRTTQFSVWTNLFLLLPLLILGLFTYKIYLGIRQLRLLERALVVKGKVISMKQPSLIGKIRASLVFKDKEGNDVTAILSTYDHAIMQKEEHVIIYDPKNPIKIELKSDLPSSIRSRFR